MTDDQGQGGGKTPPAKRRHLKAGAPPPPRSSAGTGQPSQHIEDTKLHEHAFNYNEDRLLHPREYRALYESPQDHKPATDFLPVSLDRRDALTAKKPEAERLYSIGQVARRVGVTHETLRKWQRYGWLKPSHLHLTTGTRLYNEDGLEKAQVLAEYSQTGRPGAALLAAREEALAALERQQEARRKKKIMVSQFYDAQALAA